MLPKLTSLLFLLFVCTNILSAQSVNDSSSVLKVNKKEFVPKKATLRSALLPGWGQAYNKQYWKVPIVVAGITIPTVSYFKNNNWRRESSQVYNQVYYSQNSQGGIEDQVLQSLPQRYQDAYNRDKKNPALARSNLLTNLQRERNYYLKNKQYSLLWLLILWGVNVVDATVSAHLRNFNVSDDLSIKVNATNDIQKQNGFGLSICKRLH